MDTQSHILSRRSYGVIEVVDQALVGIHLRPYPKMVSITEAIWSDIKKRLIPNGSGRDRILLYYDQPILYRKFLALKYFVSDDKSTLATIAVSLSVLDYVAKIKSIDAIVTEVTNKKIQDRHLIHFGWEPHLRESRKRNWIKRFYGEYPDSFLFQELANPKAVEQISMVGVQ